ncbi:hypothetical protein HQ35_00610 [Porphyromonas cangingivalis]|uniref:HEPN AbiU2-like domain-containing protein n=1 Tax=Porphyromonas cangingivalis TaxID=36874 RepID=A0A0A2EZW2_PORCN|nr:MULTISPECIES: hypothetical protein [Bacteria]KGN83302.1 hypothetical protein HQ35_00610 [Porphyromonas cangingivalis]MDY4040043.1 hypothetical protein [Prevotella sp.]NNH92063.1 hypothetical protein [Pasteurella multocida]
MNEQLRKEIAGFFLQDSGDYLARFSGLFNEYGFTHIGNRSKLLVDILFSIECSLKALIFFESQDDEKKTYNRIKKCSHKIEKLLFQIQSVDADFINFKKFVNQISLDEYSICSRYSLEANICFRENGVLGNKYYSTIANPDWIKTLYEEAKKLKEYVGSKDVSFHVVDFSDIDINELLENQKRLSDIAK